MWSSEPQIIELIKGERGLGFSILDYQVNYRNNDSAYFYSKDSVLPSEPSKSKFRFPTKNRPCPHHNFSCSTKETSYTGVRKSAFQNPLRRNIKDQHVRFNFTDHGKRYLSCGVGERLDLRPLSPSSPWSGSELSGTSSPSYTSNGDESNSPLLPFNYHIYI